jgi:hypothetical protein
LTGLQVVFRDICFRTPPYSTIGILSNLNGGAGTFDHCLFDRDYPNIAGMFNLSPASASVSDVILPNYNNGGFNHLQDCTFQFSGTCVAGQQHTYIDGCTFGNNNTALSMSNGTAFVTKSHFVGNVINTTGSFPAGLAMVSTEFEDAISGNFTCTSDFGGTLGGYANITQLTGTGSPIGSFSSGLDVTYNGVRYNSGKVMMSGNTRPIFQGQNSTSAPGLSLQDHNGTTQFELIYNEQFNQSILTTRQSNTLFINGGTSGNGESIDTNGNAVITGPTFTLPTFSGNSRLVAKGANSTSAPGLQMQNHSGAVIADLIANEQFSQLILQTGSGITGFLRGFSSGTGLNWDTNGNVTIDGPKLTTPILNISAAQTTVSASTSGTVVFSQPEQGTARKVVIIKFKAATGTASYTFPIAFSDTPSVVGSDDVAASLVTTKSTTAVTVTGAASSGTLMLIGY